MKRRKSDMHRGDIFYADLSPVRGSEQGGVRPVLVLQNDKGNRHSPTVIVGPITSQLKKTPLPTHVFLAQGSGLPTRSIILLEQIRTIDKSRVQGYISSLDLQTMVQVDEALRISVGLAQGQERILCLCPSCAAKFIREPGHILQRTDPLARPKETCSLCCSKAGYRYRLLTNEKQQSKRRWSEGKEDTP
jgi:mRNA interferase MazF